MTKAQQFVEKQLKELKAKDPWATPLDEPFEAISRELARRIDELEDKLAKKGTKTG